MNTRAIAALVLKEVIANGQSLSQALPPLKAKLPPKEQPLLQAMCFGVLRFYPRLNFLLYKLLQKPLKPKDGDMTALLLLGFYQLLEMRMPDYAALTETVETTRILNKPWASGLINAVLRNFLRQKDSLIKLASANEAAQFLHPNWLIKAIKKAYPSDWQAILEANNQQAPLVLRVNSQEISLDAYLQTLQEHDIPAHHLKGTEAAVIIETPCDVPSLPGYQQGWFSVQDAAAQLAATLLDLKPGQRVLDACAAPGGKTAHILELQPNLQEVWAIDIAAERLGRIQENLTRLKLKAVIKRGDAAKPSTWWDGQAYDRILLDAPCSATGVIRRHPDIKILRLSTDIGALANQQLKLLQSLWPLLKSGGLLLYATCSLLPEENQQVIEAFLKAEPQAEIRPLSLSQSQTLPTGIQIRVGEANMDGFFYSLISKKTYLAH